MVTDCLIDTGASVSIAPPRFAEGSEIRPCRISEKLTAVNGEQLPVLGEANLVIRLGFWVVKRGFVIVPMQVNPILGADFLADHSMIINMSEQRMSWIGGSVPLMMPEEHHEPGHLVLSETVETVGMSVMVASAKVISEGKGPRISGVCMVEPNKEFMDNTGVLVARAIVEPSNFEVPVQLCCPGGTKIVQKGTKLAILCEVSVMDESSETVASIGRERAQGSAESDVTRFLDSFGSSKCLSPMEQAQLEELLLNYRDVFSMGPEDLGLTNVVQHQIVTGDAQPIRQAPRRLPQFLKSDVDRQVEEMIAHGIVQPSTSPWSSPIVLVKKQNGTFRFCVDYRAVNRVTMKDAYPLPRIDETLESLGGACYFSTMDLASGYWQVGVEDNDRVKTAFTTSRGHFEFTVMPFGLSNAPATFQRRMEYVLAGLQWEHCLVYLDDIIVFSRTFTEDREKLRAVFERLRKAGLTMKPQKCQFCRESVRYLGHILSAAGLSTDEEKVRAEKDCSRPATVEELKSFIGLASYYRRFIQGFSTVAAPLFDLTRKGIDYVWTDSCERAFVELKERLISAPILAFPRFDVPFLLATDASGLGLGAVISRV